MDRRQFLATGSAVALTLPLSGRLFAAAQQAASQADAALNATFERIFDEQVATSPTFATTARRSTRARSRTCAINSTPARPFRPEREEIARTKKFIAWLEAIPEGRSVGRRASSIAKSSSGTSRPSNIGPERFDLPNPQIALCAEPAGRRLFLDPRFPGQRPHDRQRKADAEAYLSRLSRIPRRCIDDETAETAAPGRARLPRARLVARPGARSRCSRLRAARSVRTMAW